MVRQELVLLFHFSITATYRGPTLFLQLDTLLSVVELRNIPTGGLSSCEPLLRRRSIAFNSAYRCKKAQVIID